VYDMYPSYGAPATASPSASAAPATKAVQVALDRRDNGGDAAAEPTVSLARQ
jgi:hypothetical protein